MNILFEYLNIGKHIEFKSVIRKKVAELLKSENKKLGSITVVFTSNKEILQINKNYLGHNYFTDVIAFSYSHRDKISGDIYISLEQVWLNSKKFGTHFKDETIRVFIHGILHLIGYKDGTDIEKSVMRNKEDHYLCKFNDADLIKSERYI